MFDTDGNLLCVRCCRLISVAADIPAWQETVYSERIFEGTGFMDSRCYRAATTATSEE